MDATEYNSRFSKLKVEDDSPVILASKAKVKHKPKDQDRKTKTSATVRSPYIIGIHASIIKLIHGHML